MDQEETSQTTSDEKSEPVEDRKQRGKDLLVRDGRKKSNRQELFGEKFGKSYQL